MFNLDLQANSLFYLKDIFNSVCVAAMWEVYIVNNTYAQYRGVGGGGRGGGTHLPKSGLAVYTHSPD